ncbi:MAG: hypothetical protein JWR35_2296 [Marmoricola sp.]|nr:hypothetical protein [Marmoricola sp.]
MRSIDHELRYDGATLEQVYEMLSTPAFRERVCDYQHVVRRTVTITPKGDGMSVRLDQFHASDRVPPIAKKLVGSEINIVQLEDWTDPSHADIHVTIPGKPGQMTGTARLTESVDGVVETVRLSVKVSIPLVGGKLEELIAGLLLKAFKAENRVGIAWLAGER